MNRLDFVVAPPWEYHSFSMRAFITNAAYLAPSSVSAYCAYARDASTWQLRPPCFGHIPAAPLALRLITCLLVFHCRNDWRPFPPLVPKPSPLRRPTALFFSFVGFGLTCNDAGCVCFVANQLHLVSFIRDSLILGPPMVSIFSASSWIPAVLNMSAGLRATF